MPAPLSEAVGLRVTCHWTPILSLSCDEQGHLNFDRFAFTGSMVSKRDRQSWPDSSTDPEGMLGLYPNTRHTQRESRCSRISAAVQQLLFVSAPALWPAVSWSSSCILWQLYRYAFPRLASSSDALISGYTRPSVPAPSPRLRSIEATAQVLLHGQMVYARIVCYSEDAGYKYRQ